MTDTQLPTAPAAEEAAPPPIYVRFLRSGLTHANSVWRRGSVTVVTGRPTVADESAADAAAAYKVFSRTEAEQRERWPDGAYFEHLTREQYEAALGTPSVAPEAAVIKPLATVPPTEQGITRGVENGQQANPAPTSHTPPTEVTPPPTSAAPEAAPWPWYDEADVTATLGYVANMGDDEASRFLAYETSHQARSGVLGPMTGA